jgi:hypothetical protein
MIWLKATTFLGGWQLYTSSSLRWTCDILLTKWHGAKDVHNLFTSAVKLADLTRPTRLEETTPGAVVEANDPDWKRKKPSRTRRKRPTCYGICPSPTICCSC